MKFTKKQRAQFKAILGVSLPDESEIRAMSLADLSATGKRIVDSAQDLLSNAEARSRDLTRDENDVSERALEVADQIQAEVDDRSGDVPDLADFTSRSTGGGAGVSLLTPGSSWREIHGREPSRSTGEFRNFGEYVIAVHGNDTDKLRQFRAMSEGTGSSGGWAVPEIWWSEIYDSGLEASVVLDKVTPYKMTSNILHLPAWDSEDHESGPIGAVEGQWLGELQQASEVEAKLRTMSLTANRLAIYISMSSEALQDSSALSTSLGPLMRNSLAFSLDATVLQGSGIARPVGIIGSGAAINIGRAGSATIVFADMVNLLSRMVPSSLQNAVWLVSPSAFGVLVGMEVSSSTGHLAMSSSRGAGKLVFELLGREVRVTEKLPALGSKGDVVLADLSYYALGTVAQARFESVISHHWLTDAVSFRLVLRHDGKPLVSSPISPAGGGDSLSPFVVLDA